MIFETFRTELEALGFEQSKFSPFARVPEFGIYEFTKEGFIGKIEIHHNTTSISWAHRTPACGAGTGIRPEGGVSVKRMIKHIKKGN